MDNVTIQTPEQQAHDYLFTWVPQLVGTVAEKRLVELIKGTVTVEEE